MNGADWTKRYPRIVGEAARLREPLVIDAEVVCLSTPSPRPSQKHADCTSRVSCGSRPSIKPHTAASSGYRVGLHFAGLTDWSPLGHKESGTLHRSCWSNKLNNSIRSTSPSLCVFCFPRKPQLPQLFSTVAKSFLLRVILCSCLFFLAGPEQTLSALARWVVGFRHGYKTRGSRQKFPSYCPIR